MANTRNDIQGDKSRFGSSTGSTQGKTQETLDKAAQEAREQGKQAAQQAEQQARSMVNSRKEEAAEQLDDIAHAFRETGNQLRDQNNEAIARYTDSMADQVERFADYLHSGDYSRFLSDAERFARRQPELFLGGAFTLGLLAARFFKSSSPERGYSGASRFSGRQGDWQRSGSNWDYENDWRSRGRYEGPGYGTGYGQSGYRGSSYSGQRYETDELENYSGSPASQAGTGSNIGTGSTATVGRNAGMTAGSTAGQTTSGGQTTSRRSFDTEQEDKSEKK
jgi:vacuolar-type H+-ATPase subunit H